MTFTIRQALQRADALRASSDTWRLDAELLLAEAMATSRETLHTWPERELDQKTMQHFEALLARRAQGEPLAYILGRKDFWDFRLQINEHVLIPRPETELLVESVLQLVREQGCNPAQIIDLGTGSGAIAIALARELPMCQVLAVDRSAEALALARTNAGELGVQNMGFLEAFWCEGLGAGSADIIVANPPYVAMGDEHLSRGDLRFEPAIALVAAEEGLGDIRVIVEQSRSVLRNSGWLLLEHGFRQGSDVQQIYAGCGYTNVSGRQDLAGHDRVTLGQWLNE